MTLPTSATTAMSSMSSQSSLPDPASDMPTVWAPLSGAEMAATPSVSGRNTLALISLLMSLVFPIGVVVNAVSAMAAMNHMPRTVIMALVMIGGAIGTFGVVTMLGAIATGHVALVIARRYSRAGARRWMAIVGLVIGYLSLIAFVGVIALFTIAGMNGF